MINNEEVDKVFNEKLFDLIRTVLKRRPKSTINMVCNTINMSAEGRLYEKKEIVECISIAIENGLLISDENGNININNKEEKENAEAIAFRNRLKCTREELEENAKKEAEEKQNKMTGYHIRKSTDRRSRF